jgi:hypothetical protein
MITAYGDAETKRRALENGAEALPRRAVITVQQLRPLPELSTAALPAADRRDRFA